MEKIGMMPTIRRNLLYSKPPVDMRLSYDELRPKDDYFVCAILLFSSLLFPSLPCIAPP